MRRLVATFVSAVVVGGFAGSEAHAQLWNAPAAGEDHGSIGVHLGAVAPLTTFPDGSTLETGAAYGVSATGWATRHLGIRGSVLRSQNNGENPDFANSPIAVNDPTVWFITAEMVLRYPMGNASSSWFPYVSAGVGGKNYDWAVKYVGEDYFAFLGSAGIEVRPGIGPLGLFAEVSTVRSKFTEFGFGSYANEFTNEVFGEEHSHTDAVLTGGFSINF